LAQFSNKVSNADNESDEKHEEGAKPKEGKPSHEKSGKVLEEDKEEASTSTKKWKRNYDNLTDKDRSEMHVDEIFAHYLYTISRKVNEVFYRTVLTYVILFRECLNEIGW
jgi:hypothetical protein